MVDLNLVLMRVLQVYRFAVATEGVDRARILERSQLQLLLLI